MTLGGIVRGMGWHLKSIATAVDDWLIKRSLFGLALVSIAVPLALLFINRKPLEDLNVCLTPPSALADYKFYVRYVRAGFFGPQPNQPGYLGDYLLSDRRSDPTRTKCVTITFPVHYGVTFKPFVSPKGQPLLFKDVSNVLQTQFMGVDTDEHGLESDNKVFFLLGAPYTTVTEPGNAVGKQQVLLTNNYFNQ